MKKLGLISFFLLFSLFVVCQTALDLSDLSETEISKFDFGKMWTFEHPPKDHFKSTYGFEASDAWFEKVRKSSLRFSTFCSASFVSKNGLILTNHHCSRGEVPKVQKEGENFEENGFYADKLSDERRVEGLFVDQLHVVEDITSLFKDELSKAENDTPEKRAEILEKIKKDYESQPDWKGLQLQTVEYYSGGKYSIYGFKRYSDIRLVLIPELAMGYFGGDFDNFTYPRYALDFTIWRAYDENGDPLNTKDFHLPFNSDGISEGEPTFVVGNPGSTERYRTVAQLTFDRDIRYPFQLDFLNDIHSIFSKQYEQNPNDQLKNQIFSVENSQKAIAGIVKGLQNPVYFKRKMKMENELKSKSGQESLWKKMDKYYEELYPYGFEANAFNPSPFSSKIIPLSISLNQYIQAKTEGNDEIADNITKEIKSIVSGLDSPDEKQKLKQFLTKVEKYKGPEDDYSQSILFERSIDGATEYILSTETFMNEKKQKRFFKMNAKKLGKSKDPYISLAKAIGENHNIAAQKFQSTAPPRTDLSRQIANAIFDVYGTSLPPDATFTPRISDGIVKGYEYNGTVAPIMTTFFGMYDRYYSNGGKYPWNLPERWQNPPMDLLKAPCNFVSTNDIIGGNSGSPMLNTEGELVGLIFDGNIESLPGNFIYEDKYNRTVSVHSGAIVATMKYIVKANRILEEIDQK